MELPQPRVFKDLKVHRADKVTKVSLVLSPHKVFRVCRAVRV
jgi:hypothetical protein